MKVVVSAASDYQFEVCIKACLYPSQNGWMACFLLDFCAEHALSSGTAEEYHEDVEWEHMTCMIVTHEMGFAREVADQIYFTDGGVLVEHGAPKEFFASPRDPRTRRFLDQIL